VDETGDGQSGSVVIQHPDQLSGVQLPSLTAALQEPTNLDGKRAVWVAVTLGPGAQSRDLARLPRLFPSTVDVPPLRHISRTSSNSRPSSSRLGYQGQLSFSPEVWQMSMRSNWPGNVEQVSRPCAKSCSAATPD
jgi:hypothetical protein